MKEQEFLKNILTIISFILIIILFGLLIYNFLNKPKTKIPVTSPSNDDVISDTINIDDETLTIANTLYEKGTDIWMGISAKNIDEYIEKDENLDYLSIFHDYTFTNYKNTKETIKNYGFYQFKDGVIDEIFSKDGIYNLLNNSNGEFIYLNNHYYCADSWTPSSMARTTLKAVLKNDNEISFKVINNYNDKITDFIIEKEDDTWKIKKYEWIFN